MNAPLMIHHIFISPGHNFKGRHAQEPLDYPMIELDAVECVAGSGLKGDRFFNYKPDFKGQATFFSWEVVQEAANHFGIANLSPAAFRRNILVSGMDLNALIGKEFSLQDVRFFATEEAAPCYWMDRAVAAGAHQWLAGMGGLRVKILSDGMLRRDCAS